jgi:hypothetical protein
MVILSDGVYSEKMNGYIELDSQGRTYSKTGISRRLLFHEFASRIDAARISSLFGCRQVRVASRHTAAISINGMS